MKRQRSRSSSLSSSEGEDGRRMKSAVVEVRMGTSTFFVVND